MTFRRCHAKGVRVPNMCHRRRENERPSSEEVSPTSFNSRLGSEDTSPMPRKDIRVEKRCHRCHARCSGFTPRVKDVAQRTTGFRIHVTDIVHQLPGFRRGVSDVAKGLSGFRRRVTDVAPGVPESHDVSTLSRKARPA
ncbi:unnamed protein product [Heligmosomoides polygyrus]|uniref:Uncharacterized protein n=1 Tax=Heligmosomoides polygyrus TaxID=6339 RepID=A0A183F9C6_HELPZ|nr:unnamed protein product [Heligmosomoides polygyrus]